VATIKVKVDVVGLEDPKWSVAAAKPGEEVELSVKTKPLKSGQSVEFRIRDETGGLIEVLKKASASGDRQTAKWVAPSAPGTLKLKFDAVMREPPSPKNGHVTSRGLVSSDVLSVVGYKVSITSVDEAFAPHAEALHVGFKVENEGGLALKGRYEVWGERYAGGKPLYTEDFVPAAGDTTWSTWKGQANAGVLNGKHISPEFSPYRVKVVVGLDDASVKDPMGAGRGKVCVAERQFEVTFVALVLRVQSGLSAAVQDDLQSFLAVERADGSLAKDWGRLPDESETGRLRLPRARHQRKGEALNQGSSGPVGAKQHRIGDAYMDRDGPPLPVAPGKTKYQIDRTFFSRAEIPLEVEPRLRSREAAKNSATPPGIFDALAVGPARLEVRVEDTYLGALYTPATAQATYLRDAANAVKCGTDTAPYATGAAPEIAYWQQRFRIAADGDRDIGTTRAFVVGSNELTLYLNRTKLELGADRDYTEVGANAIRLAAKLTRRDDVLWVMRIPAAPHGPPIGNWVSFPPGDNCHHRYGGLRGTGPSPELLDAFSAAGVGSEPIIGKDGAFPYTANILLRPNGATSEWAEATVLTVAGARQGLAGFVFSPSTIAGDSYSLEVNLAATPYERDLGATAPKQRCRVKTGQMTVWRVHTIGGSFKLPDQGTLGLPAGVGINDPPLGGRPNPANGTGMDVGNLNGLLMPAFCEWHVPVPAVPKAPGEPHQEIGLPTYIATHNAQGAALGVRGFMPMATNADVNDFFVQWEHYREQLPPGMPANRVNAVSNAIHALPRGTSPTAALAAAQAAINAQDAVAGGPGGPDAPLVGAAIPVFALSAARYSQWVYATAKAAATNHLNALTPGVVPPVSMNVVRWTAYFWRFWSDGTSGAMLTARLAVAGFSAGDGQSFFAVAPGEGNPDTFEHEMGHSAHLVHFITGNPANSGWKHHDHQYPGCKMGYNNQPPAGFYSVPLPAVPKGPPINLNTGARGAFCAKCLLKMRGWQEELLPCNWTHPDVF
jgi:hypothetical protein